MHMGRLYYGNSSDAIEIPDRELGYLRALATTKLRRSESFTVSWRNREGDAGGRSTIWLHCSIPLRFEFNSAQSEPLDRAHLEQLAAAASSSAGVTLDLGDGDTDGDHGSRELSAVTVRSRWDRAA
jgi:hypothetical protein